MLTLSLFRKLAIISSVFVSCHSYALTIEENVSGFCNYDGTIQSTYAGAANNSYVNLSNEAGKGISWAVSVAQAGNYSVQFRYANAGSDSAVQAALRVNGVAIAHALPFPKTATWSSWANTTAFTIALNSGNNIIRLETTIATEFANIDSLIITGTNLVAGACSGTIVPKSPNGGVIAPPQAPALAAIPAPTSGVDMAQPFEGKFNVNSRGQAVYSVPIETPEGSGGFSPKISLGYNSGNGNGAVGLGWSLNAGGTITRCRQSESEDRNFRQLTFDENDRFCLNGEKLVVDANQSYGGVGSIYKTAIDNFSRITSVGGVAGSPDYFKVEHKNGRTDYYGITRLQPGSMAKLSYNAATISWMLVYSEDSAGNKIDYLYEKEHDSWPSLSEIRYAYGNSSTASTRVVFTWDTRPDVIRYTIANANLYKAALLYNVEIFNSGQSIRRYNLRYDEGLNDTEHDNLSRLSSIQECVESLCKTPLGFSWALPVIPQFKNTSELFNLAVYPSSEAMLTFEHGDINGDGLLDMAWMPRGSSETKIYYALASRTSSGITYTRTPYVNNQEITVSWNNAAMSPPLLKFTDYNSDGRKDLVVTELYGGFRTRIFLSEPQSDGTWRLSATPVSANIQVLMGSGYLFADLNGDGLEDLVRTSDVLRVRYLQPGGLGYAQEQEVSVVVPSHISSQCEKYMPSTVGAKSGDFNGDGRMDFLFSTCMSQNSVWDKRHIYTTHQSSNGGVELRYYGELSDGGQSAGDLRIRDINKDGYDDIMDSLSVWINTGAVLSKRQAISFSEYSYAIDFVDINGDGYLDRVGTNPQLKILYINYWNSINENFESQTRYIPIQIYPGYHKNVFKDFDGDGHVDYFAASSGSGEVDRALWLNSANGAAQNKIQTIRSSLGRTTTIKYSSIGATNHYSFIKGINPSNTHEFMVDITNGFKRKVYASSLAEFTQIIRNPFADTKVNGQYLGTPSFPVYHSTGGYSVVTSSHEQTSGSNDENVELIHAGEGKSTKYYYENGRFQAGGRGFLGFEKFTEVDYGRIITVNQYRQDWPFIGKLARQEKYTYYTGKLIEKKELNWGFAKCFSADSVLPNCESNLSLNANNNGTSKLGSLALFVFKDISTKHYVNNSTVSDSVENITTTERSVDYSGNTTFEHIAVSDGSSVLHNTYTYSFYSYMPYSYSMSMGRLTSSTTESNQSSQLGQSNSTREAIFDYYTSGSAIGQLSYQSIQDGLPDEYVRTDHKYNSFGQRILSETTVGNQTRRSTEYEYDASGRYLDKTYEYLTNGTDPNTGIKRLTSQVVQRDKYGTPIETRNYIAPNKFITRRVGTTAFGIPYFIANSDGSFVKIDAGINNDPDWLCPTGTATWSKKVLSGGEASVQCMDIAGRVVRESRQGSSTDYWILNDIRYSPEGQLLAKSEPIIHGDDPKYWTISYHDELNRLVYEVLPTREQDGQQGNNKIYYENNQVRFVNANTQERKEIRDPLGRISSVIDPNGGVTSFTYDERSNLKTMSDPNNNLTTMAYDLRNRKIGMADPDKGTWAYRYNAFDELICQQDATSQQTIINSYDIRGRMISRKDHRNSSSNCSDAWINSTATPLSATYWQYDSASNGMGQLAKTYTLVSGASSPEYTQRYTYDSLGRISVTETSVLGHLGRLTTHHEKTTYDQFGRVFQVFDAARATDSFEYNGVEYTYTDTGSLFQIKDAVRYGSSQKTYYTFGEEDAHGNAGGTYGNGLMKIVSSYADSGLLKYIVTRKPVPGVNLQSNLYTWDRVGNLKTRNETGGGTWIENYLRSRNINEAFEYDNLNRLTQWSASGDFSASESVSYDAIDNIRTKSGSGTYLYGNQCTHTSNAGPHAACNVGGATYNYDKNGNLINDGTGRSIQYTAYDLPSSVSKSGHITQFSYDSNRERFKRVDTNAGATTTTLYIGNVEKIYRPDGTVEWKRYIGGVAVVSEIYNNLGILQSTQEHYLHQDHLGSLSMITNTSGLVVKDFYYDPWGASRVPNNNITQWIVDQPFKKIISTISSRGFTNHEHLDEVGLIHMNGRIYDSKIARFVQADPIIQNPLRVQSLNRYSYVWNNPLNATDPSGFQTTGTTNGMTPSQLSGDSEESDECGDEENEICVTGTPLETDDDGLSDSSLTFGWGDDSGWQQEFDQSYRTGMTALGNEIQKLTEYRELPPWEKYQDILKIAGIDLKDNFTESQKLSLTDWINRVKTGGRWDYKINGRLVSAGISSTRLDEFGNFHFGVVANGFGFSLSRSMYGAGLYQAIIQGGGDRDSSYLATLLMASTLGGKTLPDNITKALTNNDFNWGDNPGDALQIQSGWIYAQQNFVDWYGPY